MDLNDTTLRSTVKEDSEGLGETETKNLRSRMIL